MNKRVTGNGLRVTERGFTLVELLVSIIILGVLIAAGTGSFMSSQKRSRDVKRKNDLRQIGLALETYYNDKGSYPLADSEGKIKGCVPDGATVCQWGSMFQADTNGSVYMVSLPAEASGLQRYFYITTDGTYYQLYTRLENTLDSDIPKNALDEARVFTDLDCSSNASNVYCNYGVSSTNKKVEDNRTVAYE